MYAYVQYGWTPLMAAVAMGHLTTARWLVDGCSVNPHEANQVCARERQKQKEFVCVIVCDYVSVVCVCMRATLPFSLYCVSLCCVCV